MYTHSSCILIESLIALPTIAACVFVVACAIGGLAGRLAGGLCVCGVCRLGHTRAAHLHHAGLGDVVALGGRTLALALCVDIGLAAGRGL